MNQGPASSHKESCPRAPNREKALEQALLNIFFTDTIGTCHVENAVEFLRQLPNHQIGPVLRLVKLIAGSVSDLLAFSFMENVEKALKFLNVDELEAWVAEGLSIYEARGLQPAREFFSSPEVTTRRFGSDNQAASIEEAASSLRMLACGLSGRNISFKVASVPSTDTETIFLPGTLCLFPDLEQNMLWYRVATAHKCAQIRYNTFVFPAIRLKSLFPELPWPRDLEKGHGIPLLIKLLKGKHPDTDLESLFCLIDTIRIERILCRKFKGIGRDIRGLKKLIASKALIPSPDNSVQEIARYILDDFSQPLKFLGQKAREIAENMGKRGKESPLETILLFRELLDSDVKDGIQSALKPLSYIGSVNIEALEKRLTARRTRLEKRFIEILGAILANGRVMDVKKEQDTDASSNKMETGAFCLDDVNKALAMIIQAGSKNSDDSLVQPFAHIQLDIKKELLDRLRQLGKEIIQDIGHVPSFYVSSAMDLATGIYDPKLSIEGTDGSQASSTFSFFTYPEWDFRRQDYRLKWCTIKEMTAKGASGSFVQDVIRRYRGQINNLRRQFEMIRQDHSVLKRQKEGQEIDIDSFVEAYADLHAHLSPSENLYRRLCLNRRDIAVLFLVDMSASTEGWISTAIKESLVLLSLSMEYVGDQYAIFGFSGMRRTGCQYFVIKEFGERLSEEVKERITGIAPRDYTRMGPAIRHSTEKLKKVEARVKILLTLSDGKPEDYDEYKGPYAIEDTRMALMEARQQGIKPFCITIDKEAREYLPRMYGRGNYVLVPEVRLLHKRVPEIYRVLTS